MRTLISVAVVLASLAMPGFSAAQSPPAFVPSESHVREALSFKLADAASARIGPLAAYEAPEGSTWDYFVCGKVNAREIAGGYGAGQELAVGVKASSADPEYAALGVGDMAAHFCEMVAQP